MDGLIGAGYGSAGERCMAISVAVLVWARATGSSRSWPSARTLKVKNGMELDAEMGPIVTREGPERIEGYIARARRKAPTPRRRRPRPEADARPREQLLHRRHAVRPRDAGYAHLQGRDLRPVLACVRAPRTSPRATSRWSTSTNYGNGVAFHRRRQRRARDFVRRVQAGRHGGHQRAHPRADGFWHLRRLEEEPVRRHANGMAGRRCASTPSRRA